MKLRETLRINARDHFATRYSYLKLKRPAEAVGEAYRRDKIMNELADYLTNSVSSRRGTLVVGQRIVSAYQPFHTENTNHQVIINHVQCACTYIRAICVRLSSA